MLVLHNLWSISKVGYPTVCRRHRLEDDIPSLREQHPWSPLPLTLIQSWSIAQVNDRHRNPDIVSQALHSYPLKCTELDQFPRSIAGL